MLYLKLVVPWLQLAPNTPYRSPLLQSPINTVNISLAFSEFDAELLLKLHINTEWIQSDNKILLLVSFVG